MENQKKKIYLEHHPQSYHCSGNCYRQRHRYTKLYLTGRYAQDNIDHHPLFRHPRGAEPGISRPAATTISTTAVSRISVTISTSRATAGFTADARWSESERTARTTTGILSASVMKGACLPAAYPRTHGHWNRKRPCWPCSGSCGLSCPKQSL